MSTTDSLANPDADIDMSDSGSTAGDATGKKRTSSDGESGHRRRNVQHQRSVARGVDAHAAKNARAAREKKDSDLARTVARRRGTRYERSWLSDGTDRFS